MTDVEVFRVKGFRYEGPSSTKKGWSDKVWAAVILKRPSVDGAFRFVAVFGPTNGTLQHRPQPWESADKAARRFEDEVRKKQDVERYDPVDWRKLVGMEPYIRGLPARMADPVASGDAARKAWQTRSGKRAGAMLGDGPLARAIDADAAANEALRDVKLDVPPRPKPEPEPEAPRMRSVRREMKDLLE
jgi:hypothetical protein